MRMGRSHQKTWRQTIGRWYRRYLCSERGRAALQSVRRARTNTKVSMDRLCRAAHHGVMPGGQYEAGMQSELRIVIDALRALVWTVRPDGYVDFCNKWWFDYTGLSEEEALGWGWHATVPPEDLPEVLERWQAIMASSEPKEHETRLRRFDGEYRWFLCRSTPLRDATGKIVKWVG